MQRRPDEPELWGAQEAARTLGVEQTNLRTVAGLPAPYDKLAATTLWRADDIRALAWKRQFRKNKVRVVGPEDTHHEGATTA